MDNPRVHDIEQRWQQALSDHRHGGTDTQELTAQSERLARELALVGGDAASALAYRIRRDALQILVADPDVPRELIDESLMRADDSLADPERARRLRLRALVTMNRTAESVDLLGGQVPSADDAAPDADGGYLGWLSFMDSVVRAYLAENQGDLADQALAEIRRVGPSRQFPHVTVAAALRQRAPEWGREARAETVEQILNATLGTTAVDAIIDVATFACGPGLAEGSFSLVEQAETYMRDPQEYLGRLAVFFRVAVEAGEGDQLMTRYTAPRWQVHAGTHPRRATCAELAEDFGAAAAARARKYDARNGNTGETDKLAAAYPAPDFDHDFLGEAVLTAAVVSNESIAYPAVGEGMNPQLGRAAAIYLGVEDAGPGQSPFPPAFNDDADVSRLRAQMQGGPEQLQDALRELYALAQDPAKDDTVRGTLAIMMFSLKDTAHFPVHDVAAQALPLFAQVGPDQAIGAGVELVRSIRSFGEWKTPLQIAVLSYTLGLISSGYGYYPEASAAAEEAKSLGYHLEYPGVVADAARILAENPDAVEDPATEAFENSRRRAEGFYLLENSDALMAEAVNSANASVGAGDVVGAHRLLAYAADRLALLERPREAAAFLDMIQLDDDAPADLRSRIREVRLQLVAGAGDDEFRSSWPQAVEEFQSAAEEFLATGGGG